MSAKDKGFWVDVYLLVLSSISATDQQQDQSTSSNQNNPGTSPNGLMTPNHSSSTKNIKLRLKTEHPSLNIEKIIAIRGFSIKQIANETSDVINFIYSINWLI